MASIKVPGSGSQQARIVVVGEAPGAEEERLREPFVGPSGRLLRSLLLQSGINPDDCWFTNLCKFRPPNNELKAWIGSNGLPTNQSFIEGLYELKDELDHIKPNVILALGNFPMKFLTGKGRWNRSEHTWTGITDYRGSILPTVSLSPGIKTVVSYHPAGVIRQLSLAAISRLDYQRLREQSAFPEIRRPEKRILIDPRGQDRVEIGARLTASDISLPGDASSEVNTLARGSGLLTFDIEYVGERLLCCGLTRSRDEAYVIPVRGPSDVGFLRDILLSGVGLNAQNGMFDCSILEWFYDIPCLPYLKHDTMIAAYNLAIEFPKDQGFLNSIYTEQPYYKDMVDWKDVRDGRQPFEDVYKYNGIDVWTEHQVMEEQVKELDAEPSYRRSFEFDMSKLAPLWDISKRGCRINREELDPDREGSLRHTLDREVALNEEVLRRVAGKEINVKSGPQIAAFLFDQMGVPKGGETPGGRAKTDNNTLAELLLKVPDERRKTAIRLVRDIRERRDLISKFLEIELDDDGRLRCHYDPAKTDTGRLSSRKFYPTGRGTNLQNVPRDNRIRALFIPDPGYEFAYADLERAESLVVAYITGDPEMLRLHQPGIDAHIETARYLYPNAREITEDQRFLAKRVRHGSNYMLGWRKLMILINGDADDTGVSVTAAEAKVLIQRYRDLHPLLVQWWREVENELRRTRTLCTLTGRRRVFHDRLESILPNAVAFVPQGTVGDVLNMGLVACSRDQILRELDFQMLLQVHDAIGFQYPTAHRNLILPRVRKCMEIPLTVASRSSTFTIPVEIKYGPSWGELTKWHPTEFAA